MGPVPTEVIHTGKINQTNIAEVDGMVWLKNSNRDFKNPLRTDRHTEVVIESLSGLKNVQKNGRLNTHILSSVSFAKIWMD